MEAVAGFNASRRTTPPATAGSGGRSWTSLLNRIPGGSCCGFNASASRRTIPPWGSRLNFIPGGSGCGFRGMALYEFVSDLELAKASNVHTWRVVALRRGQWRISS